VDEDAGKASEIWPYSQCYIQHSLGEKIYQAPARGEHGLKSSPIVKRNKVRHQPSETATGQQQQCPQTRAHGGRVSPGLDQGKTSDSH
jgi:hypothetical protein